jgi:hypothetical protein
VRLKLTRTVKKGDCRTSPGSMRADPRVYAGQLECALGGFCSDGSWVVVWAVLAVVVVVVVADGPISGRGVFLLNSLDLFVFSSVWLFVIHIRCRSSLFLTRNCKETGPGGSGAPGRIFP